MKALIPYLVLAFAAVDALKGVHHKKPVAQKVSQQHQGVAVNNTVQTPAVEGPAVGQKCADNMVFMAVCSQKIMQAQCNTSDWMKENCEATCKVCEPVNCEWNEFGNWTTCTKTCDGGLQVRQRTVKVVSKFGGEACKGGSIEQQLCNTNRCKKDGIWGDFGEWSPCTKKCGGGTETRTREVKQKAEYGGAPLPQGGPTETRACNVHDCAVDCEFGDWKDWTTCDAECGGGTQWRSREVKTYAKNGGDVCEGDMKQVQSCNLDPCPIDCEWNRWHDWEQCSVSCGNGTTSRTRNIKTYAQLGGTNCKGDAYQTKFCNTQKCPEHCEWNKFGPWGDCSKTCVEGGKGGTQTRKRTIFKKETPGGKPCLGPEEQTRTCGSRPCERICIWDEFDHWGPCSKSCGGGQQTRSRGIRQRAAYGGKECDGPEKETRDCNKAACKVKIDCKWGAYGNWSVCSKTCGGGFETRKRDVQQAAQNGGKICPGASTDLRTCNEHSCPVDCRWGSYKAWSDCTKTCGGGTRESYRVIEKKEENGGVPCVGSTKRIAACNKESCPVDCEWGNFTEYGGCSQTCGEGIQTKTRKMITFAQFGGALCTGYSTESKPCNLHECAVDCEWSDYSVWSSCSKSCGGGIQGRSRYIQFPAKHGGKECKGDPTESRNCAKDACPVNCEWEKFGAWSDCSQDCGGGWQTRSRTVKQKALFGGLECKGCARETRACNTHRCSQNCKWAPYSPWSECNKPCGGGAQNRTRAIQQPALNNGRECLGDGTQFRDCNIHSCPVDCRWSFWSQWELCSKTCGGGMQARARRIEEPQRHGGKACVGDPFEMRACNMQPCQICKDSPRYAAFCPTWTNFCATSAFVKGCCKKSCLLC